MSFDGEYGPSTWDWVAEQVTEYEASGGTRANTLRDTGIPIIVMTTVGHKHEGTYALIASKGGAPAHPGWFHNLMADPTVLVQDGPEPWTAEARQISGDERAEWFQRGIDVFPPYAEYQAKTDREIPVFLATNPST